MARFPGSPIVRTGSGFPNRRQTEQDVWQACRLACPAPGRFMVRCPCFFCPVGSPAGRTHDTADQCFDLKADTARQCRNRFFSRIPPASEASFFYSGCLGVCALSARHPLIFRSPGFPDRSSISPGGQTGKPVDLETRRAGSACLAGASFAESGRFAHILRQDVVANGQRRAWRRPSHSGIGLQAQGIHSGTEKCTSFSLSQGGVVIDRSSS